VNEECAELKQQLENQVLISQNQQDILHPWRFKTALARFSLQGQRYR
jgi:hypothetical protein